MGTFCCPLEICLYILNKVELKKRIISLIRGSVFSYSISYFDTNGARGVSAVGGGIEVIVKIVGATVTVWLRSLCVSSLLFYSCIKVYVILYNSRL